MIKLPVGVFAKTCLWCSAVSKRTEEAIIIFLFLMNDKCLSLLGQFHCFGSPKKFVFCRSSKNRENAKMKNSEWRPLNELLHYIHAFIHLPSGFSHILWLLTTVKQKLIHQLTQQGVIAIISSSAFFPNLMAFFSSYPTPTFSKQRFFHGKNSFSAALNLSLAWPLFTLLAFMMASQIALSPSSNSFSKGFTRGECRLLAANHALQLYRQLLNSFTAIKVSW